MPTLLAPKGSETDVGNAFMASMPAGLTPAQQAAYKGVQSAFAPVQGPVKPVGAISTEQGITALEKAKTQQTKLIGTSTPTVTPDTTKVVTPTKTEQPASTKVTLINPTTEQTVTFNDAGINKDNIQAYLGNGYHLSDAEGNVPSWLSPTGVTPTTPADAATTKLATAQTDLDAATAKLKNFNVSGDPQLTNLLSSITSQWDQRIAKMKSSLDSHTAALKATGLRIGEQYTGGAGGMTGGIISSEEDAAISELSSLESQKQQALIAAQSAYESQQWGRYNDLVGIAQKAYDQQLSSVTTLQKAQADQDKKLQDEHNAALTSVNIAGLFSKGVTDPNDILTNLRASGDKTTTLDDIGKALTVLSPKKAASDTFNFSQGQSSQLLAAGLSSSEVQALHDFYNGKGTAETLNGLTPEQRSAVYDVLNGTAAKKAASTVPTYGQIHKTTGGTKSIKSGSISIPAATIDSIHSKLDESRGGDNYVDPDLYLTAATSWAKDGANIKDFLKQFPISSFVNPENTYVLPQINDLVRQDAAAVTTAKSPADVSAEIDALFKTK